MSEHILALDLSTQTGWAYGVIGATPRSGTVTLAKPGASHGEIGRGFLRWFLDFVTVNEVDTLFYEVPADPRFMGSKTTFKTARILIGLPFLLETAAGSRGINRIIETTVHDARKFFLGKSPRGGQGKDLVQAKCRALGWKFEDHNAADALCVWAQAADNRQRLLEQLNRKVFA